MDAMRRDAGLRATSVQMTKHFALDALAALASETRYDAFMLLVVRTPAGLGLHEIAQALRATESCAAEALHVLERAGLVRVAPAGDAALYRAEIDAYRRLTDFLQGLLRR